MYHPEISKLMESLSENLGKSAGTITVTNGDIILIEQLLSTMKDNVPPIIMLSGLMMQANPDMKTPFTLDAQVATLFEKCIPPIKTLIHDVRERINKQ
jgi:hypothetical protein